MSRKSVAPNNRRSLRARPLARGALAPARVVSDAPSPGAPNRGRFAALSNNLIGPLNAIVGFASLLADSGDSVPAEKRRRFAAHIRDGGESLQALLERVVAALERSDANLDDIYPSSGTFEISRARSAEPRRSPDRDVEHSGGPPPLKAPTASTSAPALLGGARPMVLVADGDGKSRELIAAYLGGRGYDLHMASSGEQALSLARERRPDLVLLDAMMPDIDGFETARRLKALAGDERLPIVFVTALRDDDSRLRALDLGAEQYLEKPVGRHELRARVKNLLALRLEQRALAAQNAQLKSLQRFRHDMTAMLVHDLRSPLSAMMMNLDFALGDLRGAEREADGACGALEDCRVAGGRLFRLIANLLDVTRSEEGTLSPKRSPVSIPELFDKVLRDHAVEADARRIRMLVAIDVEAPISADPDILERVIATLVDSSLRDARACGTIRLRARARDGVELSVSHDGPPMPPEVRQAISDDSAEGPGSRSPTTQRGFALHFCRVAVKAHGGTLSICEDGEMPTCFRVALPRSAVGG